MRWFWLRQPLAGAGTGRLGSLPVFPYFLRASPGRLRTGQCWFLYSRVPRVCGLLCGGWGLEEGAFQTTGGRCMAFSGLALELYTDSILLGTGQWVRGHKPHFLWRDQRMCKGLEVAHLVKSKKLRRPGVQGSCRNRQVMRPLRTEDPVCGSLARPLLGPDSS